MGIIATLLFFFFFSFFSYKKSQLDISLFKFSVLKLPSKKNFL